MASSSRSSRASRPNAGAPAPTVSDAATGPRLKSRVIRDGLTLAGAEFESLMQLKQRSTAIGRPAKKSELLRAGLAVLAAVDDDRLAATLAALPPLKAGRLRNAKVEPAAVPNAAPAAGPLAQKTAPRRKAVPAPNTPSTPRIGVPPGRRKPTMSVEPAAPRKQAKPAPAAKAAKAVNPAKRAASNLGE